VLEAQKVVRARRELAQGQALAPADTLRQP
jgi:hypothetical protein